jgi:hypothetical protein
MFATIKKRNGQRLLTVPGWTRLFESSFNKPHNQVNKDDHLFPAYLNAEGFTGHLHTIHSFPPSSFMRWGLIALSAIALIRAEPRSHLCNQQPPVRNVPLQSIRGAL